MVLCVDSPRPPQKLTDKLERMCKTLQQPVQTLSYLPLACRYKLRYVAGLACVLSDVPADARECALPPLSSLASCCSCAGAWQACALGC